ncbi:hypothetical protein JM658_08955 [Joostella atrarenae]|uniref:Curlin associated repeat-containing protein n=1 Tax=Joostella atrarenae TaxID=679257 RepID=A0ABS9J3E4_9FLAO|nr:hypothetical protein [Joostella atrarenae]MCF8714954.1 hypothetical protein [Joostella atrarenae]
MNATKFILLIFFSGFITSIGLAQEVTKEDYKTIVAANQVQKNNLQASSKTVSESGIYISQIGQANAANVNVVSEDMNYSLYQTGVNNKVNQFKSVDKLTEVVTQTGNNNFLQEVGTNTSNISEVNTVQQGNNLLVEKYGTNSIGDNMTIKMTGSDRSVIVKNYK